MIKLYSGTPGSGKSLHLAKDIYTDLNRRYDRLVICNFDINTDLVKHPERFHYVDNSDLTPQVVIQLARDHFSGRSIKENDVCLYIDECQVIFNARTWNEDGRKEWLTFFTQHRKYGIYCVLIAQFDEMIDKQIRHLIEYETLHRKITNFGLFGLFLKVITFGDCFIALDRWYTIKQRVGMDFFKARKRYYRLYDTFNTFNSFDGFSGASGALPDTSDTDIWSAEDFEGMSF